MPTIVVRGQTLTCEYGVNLRQVLLDHQINLYNGKSKIINCRGLGSCGTCLVAIEGEISPPNWRDQTRRSLPPHSLDRNLRLACEGLRLESNSSPGKPRQTKVLGDIKVTKFNGFWGQGDKIVDDRTSPSQK